MSFVFPSSSQVMAIGDMFLCLSGGFDGRSDVDAAISVADAAIAILTAVARDRAHLSLPGESPKLQLGINSGPVAAGVIGLRAINWHIFVRPLVHIVPKIARTNVAYLQSYVCKSTL
jgi:hypothetical protein